MAGKDLPITASGLTVKEFKKKYGFDPLKQSSGLGDRWQFSPTKGLDKVEKKKKKKKTA